jgi:hypothetical protein
MLRRIFSERLRSSTAKSGRSVLDLAPEAPREHLPINSTVGSYLKPGDGATLRNAQGEGVAVEVMNLLDNDF